MTEQSLTGERNVFLGGFFGLVALAVIFRLVSYGEMSHAGAEAVHGAAMAGTFIFLAIFIYLVFRLSRFLRHPIWLTVVYCILTPFSLIPLVGLLVGVRRARRDLVPASVAEPGANLEET